MVQENSGFFRGTGVWKFPTGVVDEVNTFEYAPIPYLHVNILIFLLLRLLISKGEDICRAAEREVREETGVS